VEKHNSYLAIADHLLIILFIIIFYLQMEDAQLFIHSFYYKKIKIYLAGFMCEDAQILFIFLLCFQNKQNKNKIISQAY
jgi:hypothetical protein